MRAWLVLLSLLVSGCSGGGGGGGAESNPDDAPDTGQNETMPPPSVVHDIPVDFDGNLGTSLLLCDSVTGACNVDQSVADDETDYTYEHPGATLVGFNLTITWDSTADPTARLAVGIMRMGSNSTNIEDGEGTSPIEMSRDDLAIMLEGDNLVHIYVYNPEGQVHQDPVYGYASAIDDDFHIEGTLTFEMPS
jgi:hypothetical protein